MFFADDDSDGEGRWRFRGQGPDGGVKYDTLVEVPMEALEKNKGKIDVVYADHPGIDGLKDAMEAAALPAPSYTIDIFVKKLYSIAGSSLKLAEHAEKDLLNELQAGRH